MNMEQAEQTLLASSLTHTREHAIKILYTRFVSRAAMIDTGVAMTEEQYRATVKDWTLADLLRQIDTDIRLEQEKMKVQAELTKPFQAMVEADARLTQYLHHEFFPQYPNLQPKPSIAVEDLAIDAMRRVSQYLKPKTFLQRLRFLLLDA